ncbi:hypothetical protein J6590_059499, partial [Homalodisca vitripennis]
SNSTKLSFRIGSTESDEGGQIFTVDHVVTNKNYTGSWDNDIAVIKLNKPIKFGKNAKPIKLRTKNLKSGTKGLIAVSRGSVRTILSIIFPTSATLVSRWGSHSVRVLIFCLVGLIG